MSVLIEDCPRCGSSQTTFNVLAQHYLGASNEWNHRFEVFCSCRHCNKTTTFDLVLNQFEYRNMMLSKQLKELTLSLNNYFLVNGFVSTDNMASVVAPEHLPEKILAPFKEGSICLSVGCYNAAATMFRLCIDLSTDELLSESNENGLNANTRRVLGLRLAWLFQNGKLPASLKELSNCIKEDGNDGAHRGTLTEEDAEDLLDFTIEVLTTLYTVPGKIELAKKRRESRRSGR